MTRGEQEISFFVTGSSDSEKLFHSVVAGLRESGIERSGQIHVFSYPVTTKFFLEQCHKSDIVILDATIEPDGLHNYCVAPRIYMDHVLTVSRNYLPINYGGIRSGGTPKYPHKMSNGQITDWVLKQVEEMYHLPPRENREHTLLEFMREQQEGFLLHLNRLKAARNKFVSYRSSHFDIVRKLAGEDLRKSNSPITDSDRLFWFRPGELVFEDEILTPYRRWQILFNIEPYISTAESFLIINSPNYLESWWTVAELIVLAYNRYTGRPLPRIEIFQTDTGQTNLFESDMLPEFDSETYLRFNRYQKASDEHETVPEIQQTAQLIRKIPFLNKLSLFQEDIWEDFFWNQALLPCPGCAKNHQPQKDVRTLTERINQIDVNGFFDMSLSGLTRIQLKDVDFYVTNGKSFKCEQCGFLIQFKKELNPRYLHSASGQGDMPGDCGVHLKRLPVYRVAS